MTDPMLNQKINLKLLLVEDDQFVRDAAKRVLELQGFTIIAVGEGSAAVRFFDEQKFDLALVDINLPDGGGVNVYKEIRAKNVGFPIVLISGDLDPEIMNTFKDDPKVSFVHKPYDPVQMGEFLRSLCSQ